MSSISLGLSSSYAWPQSLSSIAVPNEQYITHGEFKNYLLVLTASRLLRFPSKGHSRKEGGGEEEAENLPLKDSGSSKSSRSKKGKRSSQDKKRSSSRIERKKNKESGSRIEKKKARESGSRIEKKKVKDLSSSKCLARDIGDIHDVVPDQENPCLLHVVFRDRKSKIVNGKYEKLLQSYSYEAGSPAQRNIFYWSIRALARQSWQQHFEMHYVHDPDVYQVHCFLVKLTTLKVKRIVRCMVLSLDKIYNFSIDNQLEPKVLRWSVGYASIQGMEVFTGNPRTFAITLKPNAVSLGGARTEALPERWVYQASSERERKWIMHELSRLYHIKMNMSLTTKLFQAQEGGSFSVGDLVQASKDSKSGDNEFKRPRSSSLMRAASWLRK